MKHSADLVLSLICALCTTSCVNEAHVSDQMQDSCELGRDFPQLGSISLPSLNSPVSPVPPATEVTLTNKDLKLDGEIVGGVAQGRFIDAPAVRQKFVEAFDHNRRVNMATPYPIADRDLRLIVAADVPADLVANLLTVAYDCGFRSFHAVGEPRTPRSSQPMPDPILAAYFKTVPPHKLRAAALEKLEESVFYCFHWHDNDSATIMQGPDPCLSLRDEMEHLLSGFCIADERALVSSYQAAIGVADRLSTYRTIVLDPAADSPIRVDGQSWSATLGKLEELEQTTIWFARERNHREP